MTKTNGRGHVLSKETLADYVQQGLSAIQIGESEGHKEFWVRNQLRKHGIKIPTLINLRNCKSLEWKTVLQKYIEEGLTLDQIADKEGLSKQSIIKQFRFHGLKSHFKIQREKTRAITDSLSKEYMQSLVDTEMPLGKIAALLDLSPGTIKRIFKRHGLPMLEGVIYRGSEWISPPCKYLKKRLTEAEIPYKYEFKPLSKRKFKIDVAFPSIMLGLEVNGTYHYKNFDVKSEILSDYHQDRHERICEVGWELIEIPSRRVYDETYLLSLIEMIRKRLD